VRIAAIAIDTSIFIKNGLRLESGLLGQLSQLKDKPVDFLMSDIVKHEIEKHLTKRTKEVNEGFRKSLTQAQEHQILSLNDVQGLQSKELESEGDIEALVQGRVEDFIDATGAFVVSSAEYADLGNVLERYFINEPPFAEAGKKKNEFPDAIALNAIESWAEENDAQVLAVSTDKDWEAYCKGSSYLTYMSELGDALDIFNRPTAPEAFLQNYGSLLQSSNGAQLLSQVQHEVFDFYSNSPPEQQADSYLYWEPDGCEIVDLELELDSSKFNIVGASSGWVIVEAIADIDLTAEGCFSLSAYDSIDKDYVGLGGVNVIKTVQFQNRLLITFQGNLYGSLDEIEVVHVDITDPLGEIDFGVLELEP